MAEKRNHKPHKARKRWSTNVQHFSAWVLSFLQGKSGKGAQFSGYDQAIIAHSYFCGGSCLVEDIYLCTVLLSGW